MAVVRSIRKQRLYEHVLRRSYMCAFDGRWQVAIIFAQFLTTQQHLQLMAAGADRWLQELLGPTWH